MEKNGIKIEQFRIWAQEETQQSRNFVFSVFKKEGNTTSWTKVTNDNICSFIIDNTLELHATD
jgi:hypothetical protein